MPPPPFPALLDAALHGDRGALARAVTRVEADAPGAADELARRGVRRRTGPGAPHVVGLTGPPGAGKSTFTDQLVARARADGERVAVIAVDPSSPRSGGAILGDRIRMERHTEDPNVYLRSLASRGHLGGLGRATGAVVDLLDVVGFDRILVETVGVGQGELAVLEVADTVVVVLTPESGDTVQTMKAGLLEIADVFVVNKADRPGADLLRRELELSVELDRREGLALGASRWSAPVHLAVATAGQGVDEVFRTVAGHLAWCRADGATDWARRRAEGRVAEWLDRVAERARADALAAGRADGTLERLRAGLVRPDELVSR